MKKYLPFLLIGRCVFCSVSVLFRLKTRPERRNASYIQLARTLSDGHGYSNVSPSGFTPASHFPPGYPVFLAFFVSLGLDNLIFFKVLNGILLFASLIALFGLSRRLSGHTTVALTAMLLACFSPHLMHFASMAMSEMLYLACTVAAFVSLYFYAVRKPSAFYCSPWFYAALLAAGAAYYVRTVGASILFAVVLFFLIQERVESLYRRRSGVLC